MKCTCICLCVCPTMRFAALQPIVMKLGMVLGAEKMKCICLWVCPAVHFAALQPIVMKLGPVVGADGHLIPVKGQVKFQITPVELKLGESDVGWEASKKTGIEKDAFRGQRGQSSGQISN